MVALSVLNGSASISKAMPDFSYGVGMATTAVVTDVVEFENFK
jgi:hypothetical protein